MSRLAVQGLFKSFGGVRALAGVAFAVAEGEVVAMIGPNGAGKSTCINAIGGQLAPDRGKVLLDGREIQGLAPSALLQRGVGRTFQVAAAFGSLSVRQSIQVAIAARERRLGALLPSLESAFTEECDQILERTGLAAQAARPCAQLAYGDLKRVDLAIALAGRPRLLLMDEPAAGMGFAERQALMQLATGLARGARLALLFTEHDMDLVFAHADRVVVLAGGRTIAAGTPAAVRADPQVRRVYLGDEPDDA